MNELLKVEDLSISFKTQKSCFEAVKGVSFCVEKSQVVAIVGESGSGKSVSALCLTSLLPSSAIVKGKAFLNANENENILNLKEKDLRKIRGKKIAYIFQDPSTSLNPVFTVGNQIMEAVKLHSDEKNPKQYIIQTLEKVGIVDPKRVYEAYPHELSGGMQQRIMIAMALVCKPDLLIADEPTTALDVTIQKQIIDLLKQIKKKTDMSIIIITHNFGIIKGFADKVLVMFRGKIVEENTSDEILANPKHPYTKALLDCVPKLNSKQERLKTIDYSTINENE